MLKLMGKKILTILCFEIITCDPLLYTLDHSDFTVSNMGKFYGLKRPTVAQLEVFFSSDYLRVMSPFRCIIIMC